MDLPWFCFGISKPLETEVSPPALRASRPAFSAVNLQTNRAFASEQGKNFFLVVLRQRAGFAVPLANFQVVDPRRDLRKFSDAADAALVPIAGTPRFDPLLGRAGI